MRVNPRVAVGARRFVVLSALISILFLADCGGSGGGNNAGGGTKTYTIGGTVSGLSGNGLVLQNNGGNNLSVSANGSFTFTTAITSGSPYSVTVLTQPSSPAQTCAVTNGTGTASANVTGVQVTCTTVATTYTIGGTVINLSGIGGGLQLQDNGGDSLLVNENGPFTFSTAVSSGSAYSVTVLTQPSSPAQICAVTNGTGTATANVTSVLVDCAQTEWTWVNGSNMKGQSPTFGTQGTAAVNNTPGALWGATGWTDKNGNFWLFGGNAASQVTGPANALWKYNVGDWTWVSGSNLNNQEGTYGTVGAAATSNVPGGRVYAAGWTDAAGNLWLFGGIGLASTAVNGDLNDLWKYSAGEWTWMGGSNVINQKGTYGTLGIADAANTPGAREFSMSWTDAAGNLWLFGGHGLDSTGLSGELNDLWKYSGGEWTWMGGSNVIDQEGTYGTLGIANVANTPGSREGSIVWTDAAGNVWLFGGSGLGSTAVVGWLNDLWKFSGGEWTWMGGSNANGQSGTYGTLGTAAATNTPGGRVYAVGWTDAAGNLWLFGGVGFDSAGKFGIENDLWEYSGGEWTWMGGSNLNSQAGTYGTLGTAAAGNIPGARQFSVSWTDAAGNFWLYGGDGLDSMGIMGGINDLWKYAP